MIRQQVWTIGSRYQLPAVRVTKVTQSEPPKPDEPEVVNYLKVTPSFIYLMPSNNFTDDVNILSNVVWTIN